MPWLGRLATFIAIFFATPAMAAAASASWTIAQKSGDVRVLRSGKTPASVQIKARLLAGDVVATGADGRAMMTNGDDYVIVSPGSRVTLPAKEEASGFTRLVQQVGTLLYKVKHTGVPHFAVDTPMLAAVVKGTTFTVVVGAERSAVQVTEGLVEVSTLDGRDRRLVEKGVTVHVGRDQPDRIVRFQAGGIQDSDSGGQAVQISGSGDVPLATLVAATGGLVRTATGHPGQDAGAAISTVSETAQATLGQIVGGDALSTVTNAPTTISTLTGQPALTTPAIAAPTLTSPTLAAPVLTAPTIAAPVLTAPTLAAPVLTAPTLTAPVVTAPVVTAPVVTAPVIPSVPALPTVPSVPLGI